RRESVARVRWRRGSRAGAVRLEVRAGPPHSWREARRSPTYPLVRLAASKHPGSDVRGRDGIERTRAGKACADAVRGPGAREELEEARRPGGVVGARVVPALAVGDAQQLAGVGALRRSGVTDDRLDLRGARRDSGADTTH